MTNWPFHAYDSNRTPRECDLCPFPEDATIHHDQGGGEIIEQDIQHARFDLRERAFDMCRRLEEATRQATEIAEKVVGKEVMAHALEQQKPITTEAAEFIRELVGLKD